MLKNKKIQDILRQEIIATRTYSKIFQEMDLKENSSKFKRILQNHQQAVTYWREQENDIHTDVVDLCYSVNTSCPSQSPDEDDQEIIEHLRAIETHKLGTYKDLLNSFEIEPSQRSYIKTILLPAQQEHLKQIEGLKKLRELGKKERMPTAPPIPSLRSNIA